MTAATSPAVAAVLTVLSDIGVPLSTPAWRTMSLMLPMVARAAIRLSTERTAPTLISITACLMGCGWVVVPAVA